MGQILDVVPNHMCIGRENRWWSDVLENGPGSAYAPFFDIDWNPVRKELTNKILLPVLGSQYGTALENGELKLSFEDGAFFIQYYDYKLPVRPKSYTVILEHLIDELKGLLPGGDPRLMELLSIITAVSHLPRYIESDPDKLAERYREKEVIKKRLLGLYSGDGQVKEFIDENIRIFNGKKGDPRSFDLLDDLLAEQIYRLSNWPVASDEINYRRFFDINELAAIRMEIPEVFDEAHRLIFRLIREGKATGLRVDHPDGLYDPAEYFRKLQRNCYFQGRLGAAGADGQAAEAEILKHYDERLAAEPGYKPFYIVGEKILIKGERMPEDWPIFSTTGYVFLNSLNGIFVDSKNSGAFDGIYNGFTRSKKAFGSIAYEKKKQILQVALSGEVNTLAHYLNRISEKNRHTRDFTLNSLLKAIVDVIAFFPVYRTYIGLKGVNERDRRYIELAVTKASRNNPAFSESVFEFLRSVLLLRYPAALSEDDRQEWLDFVMRFQQLTAPVMAKAVEDTAFYIYNRLVSLNEVGGSPERFGTPIETFHGQNLERAKFWPHALIATSTHDTKRGEDVRARINVLSEMPDEWGRCLKRWNGLNRAKHRIVEGRLAPDRNEEYLLYQTLLGAWPTSTMDEAGYETFKKRIRDYMLKAVREAKVNSSWINPNAGYEKATMAFIDGILDDTADNPFLLDFEPLRRRLAYFGMLNSLSQTLLKIASPGVPDFYQGTELWDFSLVDPDNRRPVDYELRAGMLKGIKSSLKEGSPAELAKGLASNLEDGRIKLYVIHSALNYRRQMKRLFDEGEYHALEPVGERAENVCAFSRRLLGRIITVIAPRFFTRLVSGPGELPLGEAAWKDTSVAVPFDEAGGRYRNIFTDETVAVYEESGTLLLRLSEVFTAFPVALLERIK